MPVSRGARRDYPGGVRAFLVLFIAHTAPCLGPLHHSTMTPWLRLSIRLSSLECPSVSRFSSPPFDRSFARAMLNHPRHGRDSGSRFSRISRISRISRTTKHLLRRTSNDTRGTRSPLRRNESYRQEARVRVASFHRRLRYRSSRVLYFVVSENETRRFAGIVVSSDNGIDYRCNVPRSFARPCTQQRTKVPAAV